MPTNLMTQELSDAVAREVFEWVEHHANNGTRLYWVDAGGLAHDPNWSIDTPEAFDAMMQWCKQQLWYVSLGVDPGRSCVRVNGKRVFHENYRIALAYACLEAKRSRRNEHPLHNTTQDGRG